MQTPALRCLLLATLPLAGVAGAETGGAPSPSPASSAVAGQDVVASDRWYVGVIGGRPSMSMHEVITRHADGSATSLSQQEMVALRSITGPHGAQLHATVGSRETDRCEEDAQGQVLSFVMDEESAGVSTLTEGAITRDAGGQHVHAVVRRLGRATPVEVTVPADEPILSDHALQKRASAAKPAPAPPIISRELIYLDELKVAKETTSVTSVEPDGTRHLSQILDVVPIPMLTDLDAKGEVARVHIDLGVMAIDCTPCASAPTLLGAELPSSGLIANAGAQPQPTAMNRFRLPPGAQVLANEFQRQQGALLTVSERAAPGPLGDRALELASEPRIETDDAALRAWAQEQVQGVVGDGPRAEALRAAVRSYITGDLATPTSDALQTFRTRRGACTEHAALLCAALRIVGIPARVEIGVVWAADYGGWVGHAWNSAYIDGAWRHLDSAFPGVPRSCYLALARGSGGGVDANVQLVAALGSFAHQAITTQPPE